MILREAAGWTDERAAAWAHETTGQVGGNPYLTHDHVAWQVAPLLVPDDAKARLGPRLNAFEANVELAIHGQDPRGLNVLDDGYDWAAARARVARLVELARQGVDPDEMWRDTGDGTR